MNSDDGQGAGREKIRRWTPAQLTAPRSTKKEVNMTLALRTLKSFDTFDGSKDASVALIKDVANYSTVPRQRCQPLERPDSDTAVYDLDAVSAVVNVSKMRSALRNHRYLTVTAQNTLPPKRFEKNCATLGMRNLGHMAGAYNTAFPTQHFESIVGNLDCPMLVNSSNPKIAVETLSQKVQFNKVLNAAESSGCERMVVNKYGDKSEFEVERGGTSGRESDEIHGSDSDENRGGESGVSEDDSSGRESDEIHGSDSDENRGGESGVSEDDSSESDEFHGGESNEIHGGLKAKPFHKHDVDKIIVDSAYSGTLDDSFIATVFFSVSIELYNVHLNLISQGWYQLGKP
jgi:hypothetical protein